MKFSNKQDLLSMLELLPRDTLLEMLALYIMQEEVYKALLPQVLDTLKNQHVTK